MSPDMAAAPTSKAELIAALATLAAWRPDSKADLKLLQQESLALALHVQHNLKGLDLPHEIWHFLSDADIRFKDAAYAKLQLEDLQARLREWQSGGDI